MVGKLRRDTSSVTATPSTVTSLSAASGRWAFGIGRPRRGRRGRMDIVKGRSVRSDAIAWTMLSCSGSGISAICFALTRPTTIRLGRICRSTRMRRHRAPFMPLAALCRRHFSADFIANMSEFDFRQAQLCGQDSPPLSIRVASMSKPRPAPAESPNVAFRIVFTSSPRRPISYTFVGSLGCRDRRAVWLDRAPADINNTAGAATRR
jgi:hypothetical protein